MSQEQTWAAHVAIWTAIGTMLAGPQFVAWFHDPHSGDMGSFLFGAAALWLAFRIWKHPEKIN